MEVSDVRRRLKRTVEQARREAAARRARVDAAANAYESFLESVALPVFRLFATALSAEGYPFKVLVRGRSGREPGEPEFTPAGGLRLGSERSKDDFIELDLDVLADEPLVIGRTRRGRGSRVVEDERPLRSGTSVDALSQEDVLEFLLEAIRPFVEK